MVGVKMLAEAAFCYSTFDLQEWRGQQFAINLAVNELKLSLETLYISTRRLGTG